MASSPITSWQIDGETMETDFISWGTKLLQMVAVAMKLRHLLLERKAVTNLDSILKSRDITLPTNIRIIQAMFFPMSMYGCESWTIKKTERQKLMLPNFSAGEDSLESLGQQRDQTSQY